MPEEQEPVSLSDDALDDTIKIKRVKLPLNGINTNNTLNEQNTHNANGNGHHANGNISAPSVSENHPFFDAIAAEDTAKLPILQPDRSNGNGLDTEHEPLNEPPQASPVTEEATFDGNDPTVGAQFIAPSSPTSASIPSSPTSASAPIPVPAPLISLPASQTLPTQQSTQPRNLPLPLRPVARLWKFSRLLFIAIVLIPIIVGCFYAYIQLNQSQSNLYTVDSHTGNVLWQHPEQPAQSGQTATNFAQTALVDAQGSVQIATVANNEQQLIALDAYGTVQWQSFTSDGTFALPPIHAAAGTVLATLSEQTATGHTLTLYSFNRATGHSNWQYTITQPAQAQSTDILGADTNFIYVVRTQPLVGSQTQVQLLAINQYTGYIGWRVDSPAEPDSTPLDRGTLLLSGQALVWQVEATIQVIDATQGTTLWTYAMPYNNITTFQQEEAQMVVLHGQLIVERNDSLHAFDLSTGNQLWNVSVFEFATGTTPASIAIADQAVLVYGNGELEAIAVSNQRVIVIWQQREMGNILGFHVSDDGRLIYVILLNVVENSSPAQALVAFDAQNGAARWTFQPDSQITFLDPQSDGFQYHRGVILTLLCLSNSSKNTCNHPRLYALNATTGDTLWKFDGNSVSNPLLSADGKIVTYQGNTNAWQQFIDGLRR